MTNSTNSRQLYLERARRFAGEVERLEGVGRRLSTARALVFVGAIGLFLIAELSETQGTWPALGGVALLVVFALLVARHRRIRRELRWREGRRRYNEEGARRAARDWDALPGSDFRGPGPSHDYAFDLDLFGRASLFQLLGTVSTPPGQAMLSRWLLEPSPPAVIRKRQPAVAELAPMLETRERLAVLGRLDGTGRAADVDRFLDWAEDRPWLIERPALVWATRLLPVLTAVLIVLQFAGFIDVHAWLLPVLAGLTLTYANNARISGTYQRAFARGGAFRQYAGLLESITEIPASSPRLRALQAELSADGIAAHRRMRRLGRISEFADLRFSTAHFPIHALTLWDFHVLYALERWQRDSGPRARGWIEALGEVDALAALAALAYDNPDWAFPEIADQASEPTLTATGLGHPLLPEDGRVVNDVTVGPPGTCLLVTGSNMSGKSTLLRAIGTNVVLAQAGGPVCATAMSVPPLELITSMRITDSLERGVSYFMAELNRLKQVVDTARRAESDGGRTLLYLLDEILHGTNTAERQVAAQRVIRFLVDHGAIGAVSTHDLAIADAPELADAAHKVHFTETVERDDEGRLTMGFDYTLRPGVATSTNALALMEIVGLGVVETRKGGGRR